MSYRMTIGVPHCGWRSTDQLENPKAATVGRRLSARRRPDRASSGVHRRLGGYSHHTPPGKSRSGRDTIAGPFHAAANLMAEIRIGVSGWRYAPWRGVFYPKDLAQRRELEYASRCFSAIEINGSFYSLQRPESYARWYADTPPGFVFAVKGGRYITHMRKLRDVQEPVANFLASGIFNLQEKLGPILWQFPPTLKYDRGRLEPFLALLPHDTHAACSLARGHAAWMKNRIQLAAGPARTLRHAIEIRHESFLEPSFIELLRAYQVGLVIAETAGRWPLFHDVTTDFVYIRLHGDQELYRSGYGEAALARWARRICAWAAGEEPADTRKILPREPRVARRRDVYCFFDNTDDKLRAPFDAQVLTRKVVSTLQHTTSSANPRRRPALRRSSSANR
jgi:uncharacterized protein YecE (DUF72 family)